MTCIQHFPKEKPSVQGIRCITKGSLSLWGADLWSLGILTERLTGSWTEGGDKWPNFRNHATKLLSLGTDCGNKIGKPNWTTASQWSKIWGWSSSQLTHHTSSLNLTLLHKVVLKDIKKWNCREYQEWHFEFCRWGQFGLANLYPKTLSFIFVNWASWPCGGGISFFLSYFWKMEKRWAINNRVLGLVQIDSKALSFLELWIWVFVPTEEASAFSSRVLRRQAKK